MLRLALLFLFTGLLSAQTVYYTIWFDAEDYVHPLDDEATLRLAQGLTKMGVPATFKFVAEKARILEKRGRRDVIAAMASHDIGYHSENHSIPPTPAVYMNRMGMLDGAAEFERREGPGLRDVERIFGKKASCYGQPGSSWGPQSTISLRRMGVPAYVDEARHIAMANQPFWFGGLLHVFNLGPNTIRVELNASDSLGVATKKFDDAVARLRRQGGGVIQTYYHPNEFVVTEFWDGVNFSRGAWRGPNDYILPKERTKESSEQAYKLFFDFIAHVKGSADLKVVTARDLVALYADTAPQASADEARRIWRDGITSSPEHSAAEYLLALLNLPVAYVDGPVRRGLTSETRERIPRAVWARALADVKQHIQQEQRLPSEVWLGTETLSLADFAATLKDDDGENDPYRRQGKLLFENHIATDGKKSFNWVIHPEGFDGSALLELGRLQAWTLKPARIKKGNE
jgi:hypothetical protein